MAPTQQGYWGEPTSTLDWCEGNYEVSFYIAEFWNTLSNLAMIIPPLIGVYDVLMQKFERRFILCHVFLLIVGLGSWAFHMTLQYEMQLLDELPMVWGTSVLVYCLAHTRRPPQQEQNWPLCLFLVAFCVTFTATYLFWKHPLFHHVSYGILVFTTFAMDLQLARTQKCEICLKLFAAGSFTYILGFVLWNIDNIFCPQLTSARQILSSPPRPFTQLHAWWHVMAGYATYLHVLFTIHARSNFLKENCKVCCTKLGLSIKRESSKEV